jgi:hypothetical protein
MNLHLKLITKRLKIAFLFIFTISNFTSYSQNIYLRISDKDCSSCYAQIHSAILNPSNEKLITLLFPKSYEGVKFDKFNELFFNNSLKRKNAIFSDELIEIGNTKLNNSTGIFVTDREDKEILFYLNSERLTTVTNLDNLLLYFSSLSKSLDFDLQGISDRASINYSYKNSKLYYLDTLFKVLYIVNSNGDIVEYDFKKIDSDDLMKSLHKDTDYKAYIQNKHILESYGKASISISTINISDEELIYIDFRIPKIIVEKEGNNINNIIMNVPKTLIITENELLAGRFLNYVYDHINPYNHDGLYYSLNSNIYKNELLRLNLFLNNEERKPFITKFKIDHIKKEISFNDYVENVFSFDFQYEEDMNESQYIQDIDFSIFGDFLYLKSRQYLINLVDKKILDLGDNNKIIQILGKLNEPQYLIYSNKNHQLLNYSNKLEPKDIAYLYLNEDIADEVFVTESNIFFISKLGIYSVNNIFK